MTVVNWPTSVNKKFYAFTKTPADNFISSEFASGRKTVILKNTRFVNNIKCSLTVSKKSGEYEAFWNWFTLTLGGLSGVFSCSALGSSYYRFSATPNATETQTTAKLDFEIEEIY